MAARDGKIQTGVFEDLQRKIDEDTAIKDVRLILRTLHAQKITLLRLFVT